MLLYPRNDFLHVVLTTTNTKSSRKMTTLFYPICTQKSTAFDKNYATKKWSDFIASIQSSLEKKCDIVIKTEVLQSICYETLQKIYHVDTSQLQIVRVSSGVKPVQTTYYKTATDCKNMPIAKLREYVLLYLDSIRIQHPTLNEKEIQNMKKETLSSFLILKKPAAKPVQQKASEVLKKEMTKLSEVKQSKPLIDFKKDNPVNISSDAFWKVKVNTFLYVSEEEEEEHIKLEHHALTGFLFKSSSDQHIHLFGRVVDGNVLRWDELEEEVLVWAQRCGIQVDL